MVPVVTMLNREMVPIDPVVGLDEIIKKTQMVVNKGVSVDHALETRAATIFSLRATRVKALSKS